MVKMIGPKDVEMLNAASDRLKAAEANADRTREAFVEQRTENNKGAWVAALFDESL